MWRGRSFGGEDFILQTLSGDGLAFLSAGGTIPGTSKVEGSVIGDLVRDFER